MSGCLLVGLPHLTQAGARDLRVHRTALAIYGMCILSRRLSCFTMEQESCNLHGGTNY